MRYYLFLTIFVFINENHTVLNMSVSRRETCCGDSENDNN